ncbi:amidohydrolase [Micromonospora acroterricola]|uniref:Amidohydrolase n=1 Tax=Micromonospora acroterricola TaxID=2202421 RepID=A0A317D512_9ACTN|nr:amidohydrolase [Micromonospora acroterricola]
MVDGHHHLWDPAVRAYPWLSDDALTPIRRPYTVADLRAASGGRIAATVLVQTVPSAAETEEFLATARASGGLVAGVVGWLDLTRPDIADEIDRLRSDGPLVGVRHQAQDEPDPAWLRRPDVTRGIAAVGAGGLAYDILVRAPQRPAALATAQRVDGVRFVVDHAGKPGIAAGEWEPWASWVTAMARCPGVVCKLSGLVTEAAGDWDATRIRPYAEHVLSAFGADRVLFGSDWPVCELTGRYADVLALTDELLVGCTESERAAVLSDTARAVYALP